MHVGRPSTEATTSRRGGSWVYRVAALQGRRLVKVEATQWGATVEEIVGGAADAEVNGEVEVRGVGDRIWAAMVERTGATQVDCELGMRWFTGRIQEKG